MTDYLFSVKKLVDRLNQQSSENYSRKKSKIKIPLYDVSGTCISVNETEVRFRNKNRDNEIGSKRKKRRPKTEISDPNTRRQSLYQVIKLNKEKLSGKHGGESYLKSPATTASNSPASSPLNSPLNNKNKTVFEFNIYNTSDDEKRDSDSATCARYREQKYPCEDKHSALLLSPNISIGTKPNSPNRLHLEKCNSSSSDKSVIPEADLRSPSPYDTVFQEWDSPNCSRKNSEASRQRLSVSKSMPLSPPIPNAERSAQQFCNFQLKLDTLRAELLAMRKADQELAKKLLSLYSEIQILKVKNSCMNYSELIDEAVYEAEMADDFPDMCDAPRKFTNKLLTSHGVTSFNIHSRRFSCS
ncbi:uncharacterized protein LOC132760338 [Ruditapes philippinarum]|uniref:uncharacterized protein LOC132760338 n=1 Tax=Ruditapes philippinarum TaxID=129788 RepID=UPI00295B1232|nr:uncharacterized protein LOC132760338 [Ruditapes philippinarum]